MEVRQRRAQAIIMALMIVSLAAEALFQIRTQNTSDITTNHLRNPVVPVTLNPHSMEGPLSKTIHVSATSPTMDRAYVVFSPVR